MTVRIRGLRKLYGPRRALDLDRLEVPAGSVALVTGPNGAGKSTLLRCVAGVTAYEGSLERPHGPVAYLPQGEVLPPGATAGEVLRLFGTSAEAVHEWVRVDTARRIARLSGGERRRVALAAVLSLRSSLYVLDEPFADLDGAGAAVLLARLGSLRATGAAIIVAAPDRESSQVARAADAVIRLESGRIAVGAGSSAA